MTSAEAPSNSHTGQALSVSVVRHKLPRAVAGATR